MDANKINRFATQWWRIFASDSWAQAFGWAAALSALLVAEWQTHFSVTPAPTPFQTAEYTVSGGLILASVWNAVAAVIKARLAIHPLILDASDTLRPPGYTFDDKVRGYSATIIVRNQSGRYFKDCVAHVINAPNIQGAPSPRFLETFDLPPKTTKNVFIAYWFSRESPHPGDKHIHLVYQSTGGFFNDQLYNMGSDTELCVRIEVPDIETKVARCRAWIDTTARCLKVSLISIEPGH